MIDELYRRLGPPRPPRPIDWPFAERRLGTALPAEVKALVDRYGPGHLGGVIELLSPEEPRSARNLVVQVRRNSFETSPIGLLVLANDAEGRPLRWQRIGEPDFLFSPDRVEQALDAARAMQPHFLDPVTDEPAYRVWPEPGGLLPWARPPQRRRRRPVATRLSPTRRDRRARRTRRPRA